MEEPGERARRSGEGKAREHPGKEPRGVRTGADVQKCSRLAEPCVEKGVPGGKPKLNGLAGSRADLPEVIRYFEARKRKCQFANPGRKLRRRAQAL